VEAAGTNPDWEEDDYVVSISDKRRQTRIHRVGWCYRKPGVHYGEWRRLTPDQVTAGSYDMYCKDCFGKDGDSLSRPTGIEDATRAQEVHVVPDGPASDSSGTTSSSSSASEAEAAQGQDEGE
jgi:hypothetical protein